MINYTNPDRKRFVNIAAMGLFNVPTNEEVTVVDIIDKLRSHYQIIVAADYYPNICCYYPYIRTTQYVPKRISNKALVKHFMDVDIIPIKNFITSVLTHVDLQQAINVYLK